ncbi:MAG: trehalose-phosphatase [Gammaproteobacteria bacterium]
MAGLVPDFAKTWALFLDVDGTLLDFVGHPHAVELKPELVTTLSSLHGLVPVALISGRPIVDLDRLFTPLRLPVAGQHGAERRTANGRTIPMQRLSQMSAARDALADFAEACPGLLLEDKGLTLALHYRLAPQLESEVEAMMKAWMQKLGGQFILLPGNMVYELRPTATDKGAAIAAFMEEPPFAGRVPVFIGDDTTDEDGFRMVNGMGGLSVKVGGGQTVADWRLSGVATVLQWLEDYVRWLGRKTTGITA